MDKKSFSTSTKFGKYRNFLKNLTEDQKAVVKSFGFGSLLHFDCSEAPRSLVYSLAQSFDVATRTVKFNNGSSFQLNAFVVHQILGVPIGGRRIRASATNEEKEIIANLTGTSSIAPTVDQLFELVTNDLTADNFARIFMLISLAIFLCPTTLGSASKHYYSAVACVADIPKYDWCSFILDWLVDGIMKFQNSLAKDKRPSLCGCFFVLVVAYFEYIKTPDIILREDYPRIKIWDDHMIGEYLSLQGNGGPDASFESIELKDPSETPFVNVTVSSSIFGKLPALVESFIQTLPPHNSQPNLRGEIREMCTKFHRELMTASVCAMQPVVSRQLCSMAEYMWNGLQNHNAPATSPATAATSTQMDKNGVAGSAAAVAATSTQMDKNGVAGSSGATGTFVHTDPQDATEAPAQVNKDVHTQVFQRRVTRSASRNLRGDAATSDAACPSLQMDSHGAVETPTQIDDQDVTGTPTHDTTVPQSWSTQSSSRRMTSPRVRPTSKAAETSPLQLLKNRWNSNLRRDVMSSGKRKNSGKGKMASVSTKSTSNNEKGPVPNEISVENIRDTELDTGQNKTADGGENNSATQLDTNQDKIARGGDNCTADLVSSPADNPNQCATNTTPNKIETIVHDENAKGAAQENHGTSNSSNTEFATPTDNPNHCATTTIPSRIEATVDDGNGKAAAQDQGFTNNTCINSTSDSTSLGTIYCAQPYTYQSPNSINVATTNKCLSMVVYGSHIKSDIKGIQESASAAAATPHKSEEVVPDSYDASETDSYKRKRKRAIRMPGTKSRVIDLGSDSTGSNKKLRVSDQSTFLLKKTTKRVPCGLNSKSKEPQNIEPVDDCPRIEETETKVTSPGLVEKNAEVEPSIVQDGSTSGSVACADEVKGASKMFTRKRAIKQPIHVTPSVFFDLPHKKIEVSTNERTLFHLATKRLTRKDEDADKIIADIGRHYVTKSLFGASLRPRSHVGTFVMNVFCEALNLDYSANPDLNPSKFFFTTDITDKLITEKFDAARCSNYLFKTAKSFCKETFNMVMIPVCISEHWWLVVANIRDHRFDVLNSMKTDTALDDISLQICDNFRKLYHALFQQSDILDKKAFPASIQEAPQQENTFDCGIYVMRFMQLWDGRKVNGVSQNDMNKYRQKYVNYILRHSQNKRTTDDVNKCIGSER